MQRGEITRRLVELHYVEALLLMDEAQAFLDHPDIAEIDLPPDQGAVLGVVFESIFDALEAVIDWLRARRGDIPLEPQSRLAPVVEVDQSVLDCLPLQARVLVGAARDLYDRIARLEAGFLMPRTAESPARSRLGLVRAAFGVRGVLDD